MNVDINWWGVILGAVATMLIGAIYYSPWLLEAAWMKSAKVDKKRFEKDRVTVMPLVAVVALLVSFMVAYFSFLFHAFFQYSWLVSSIDAALLLWIGFSATTVVVHGVLEQKSRQLIYITIGNRLLSYLAVGLLVGWLHP
ncbi:MAG TPA: DUF1761 domain-containing protein [Candidatus Saccharimonadales bacterium]|nr:DUF1761 domain-containing protein [Candidatus Saccharimonadales bacterium]